MEEETTYQKHVKWLEDHGKPITDAATKSSDKEKMDSLFEDEWRLPMGLKHNIRKSKIAKR